MQISTHTHKFSIHRVLLAVFICGFLFFAPKASAYVDDAALDTQISDVSAYLLKTVPQPEISSVGGEWAVLGLARAGIGDAAYFDSYRSAVRAGLRASNGILHTRKYTEYARVTIALTVIGENPLDFAGYDIVTPLADTEKVLFQGTAGAIWALMALDCGDYPDGGAREIYIAEILKASGADGGFSFVENGASDADLTAMALDALAPYYKKDAAVKQAVDKGFSFLSENQNADGSYSSGGKPNAESTAQVLVTLGTYGLSETDGRFVKNGYTALDALLSFRLSDGGFRHVADETVSNAMATEQGFYALVSVRRQRTGKCSLFDLSDAKEFLAAVEGAGKPASGLPGKSAQITPNVVKFPGKTFADIVSHPSRSHIETLAARGVLNGKSDERFDPDELVTRAEFCAMVIRALGIDTSGANTNLFADVPQAEWFAPYIGQAFDLGIVNGISETEFSPHGHITREDAAVMIERAARLCGIDTALSASGQRDALSVFADYRSVNGYAQHAVAFCLSHGILSVDTASLYPQKAESRAEIADRLFGLLNLADLLS